jgi:hypothetical protein
MARGVSATRRANDLRGRAEMRLPDGLAGGRRTIAFAAAGFFGLGVVAVVLMVRALRGVARLRVLVGLRFAMVPVAGMPEIAPNAKETAPNRQAPRQMDEWGRH